MDAWSASVAGGVGQVGGRRRSSTPASFDLPAIAASFEYHQGDAASADVPERPGDRRHDDGALEEEATMEYPAAERYMVAGESPHLHAGDVEEAATLSRARRRCAPARHPQHPRGLSIRFALLRLVAGLDGAVERVHVTTWSTTDSRCASASWSTPQPPLTFFGDICSTTSWARRLPQQLRPPTWCRWRGKAPAAGSASCVLRPRRPDDRRPPAPGGRRRAAAPASASERWSDERLFVYQVVLYQLYGSATSSLTHTELGLLLSCRSPSRSLQVADGLSVPRKHGRQPRPHDLPQARVSFAPRRRHAAPATTAGVLGGSGTVTVRIVLERHVRVVADRRGELVPPPPPRLGEADDGDHSDQRVDDTRRSSHLALIAASAAPVWTDHAADSHRAGRRLSASVLTSAPVTTAPARPDRPRRGIRRVQRQQPQLCAWSTTTFSSAFSTSMIHGVAGTPAPGHARYDYERGSVYIRSSSTS